MSAAPLGGQRRQLIRDLVGPLHEFGADRSWVPDPEALPLETGTIGDGPFGFTITYRTAVEDGVAVIEWLEQGRMTVTALRRRAYGDDVEDVAHEQPTYSLDGSEDEIKARRAAMHRANQRFWEMVRARGLDTDITFATAVNRALLTQDST